jgi:predicted secreted hydrolase
MLLFGLTWGAQAVDRSSVAIVATATRLSSSLKGLYRVSRWGERRGERLFRPYAKIPLFRRGHTFSWVEKKYGMGPLKKAMPTAPLSLPRDLAGHDWTKTEWWYYTGHLASADGRRFGFEITFFTYRLSAEDGFPLENEMIKEVPVTAVMGHFAVIDESANRYRSGIVMGPEVGVADISREKYHLRFATWKAQGDEKDHRIFAETLNMRLSLSLTALKAPVLHGDQGIVMKDEGVANYYLSITRLSAQGTLHLAGQDLPVEGQAWFDREFGYMGQATVKGWEWLSIQLDNNTEIMVYTIKDQDGQVLKESQACFIDAQGKQQYLPLSDIKLEVRGQWRSPRTRADYPSGWRLIIPQWKVDLVISPTVADQEFTRGPLPYWEGSCNVTGSHQGRAFVELVGYARGWGQRWLKLVAKIQNR